MNLPYLNDSSQPGNTAAQNRRKLNTTGILQYRGCTARQMQSFVCGRLPHCQAVARTQARARVHFYFSLLHLCFLNTIFLLHVHLHSVSLPFQIGAYDVPTPTWVAFKINSAPFITEVSTQWTFSLQKTVQYLQGDSLQYVTKISFHCAPKPRNSCLIEHAAPFNS